MEDQQAIEPTLLLIPAGRARMLLPIMHFEKIWIDQCRATRAIKRRFGGASAAVLNAVLRLGQGQFQGQKWGQWVPRKSKRVVYVALSCGEVAERLKAAVC
jgi:hypothetical protein